MKSPCNQTCKIDCPTGFCIGCGRNLHEIEEWISASKERQQQILDALPTRIALLAGGKPAMDLSQTEPI